MSEQMVREPEVRAPARRNTALWGGVALLAVGVYLLFDNLGVNFLSFRWLGINVRIIHNWWALFIVVPGLIILRNTYAAYQSAGALTRHTRSQLVAGGLMTLVGLVFMFGLSMGSMWPLLLIGAGVLILFNR